MGQKRGRIIISQLTGGTIVNIYETVSGAQSKEKYIYLGLDESGNARMLRYYAAEAKRMNDTAVASYSGCEADVWLEDTSTGFLSRFDSSIIGLLRNTSISYTDWTIDPGGAVTLVTISRRCFLLSYTEEGFNATTAGSEGQSYLPALKALYLSEHPDGQTAVDNQIRIGYNLSGSAVRVWMRSGYNTSYFRMVNDGGNASEFRPNNANWLRPALSVTPNAEVKEINGEYYLE